MCAALRVSFAEQTLQCKRSTITAAAAACIAENGMVQHLYHQ